MISTRSLYLVGFLSIGVLSQALGQPQRGQTYQGSAPAGNSSSSYYGGGYGGGYHSSTAAEGAMRGMGDVVRAQGESNLNNSMAARNMQEAYDRSLDNRVKEVETYRWRRDTALARQKEEIYEMRLKSEKQLAKVRLKPLDPREFNTSSGNIAWPMLLREPVYTEYRETLEHLFSKRATYGGLQMAEFTEATKIIKDWRSKITADKKNIPKAAMSPALRFLLRLDRELKSNLG